ncbi:sugar phosphate isomerase/epimerase family protein [Robertmurraya sp.]|uniref:sugar phosphate isomerase/epimerase family protein n=1 Tax=Robertmurraya sp. TaxID=2837525 RepID=UPI00370471F1
MKLSVCTISFRHHLYSLDEIARWAKQQGFHGIELWGIHAKNIEEHSYYGKEWLHSLGLETSMLSDYLPLDAPIPVLREQMQRLSSLAKHWGTKKIRVFSGQKGSAEYSNLERIELVTRLKLLCKMAESEGQQLLLETHPNTFTDHPKSTLELLLETNHPNLRINFDVLHVWESGANPIDAFQLLYRYISHFHFKNISSRLELGVFSPDNVYRPSGNRKGMVSIFEGEVDYRAFLKAASNKMDIEASLEWFGSNPKEILKQDLRECHGLAREVFVESKN